MSDVKLSKKFTVKKYLDLEASSDKKEISKLLLERFEERYLSPMLNCKDSVRSGFSMMAIACLTIEAFEPFRSGLQAKNRTAFEKFFRRHPEFGIDRGWEDEFYESVRCGIFHDAETRGGWRIWRVGSVFDSKNRIINAELFLQMVRASIHEFCDGLSKEKWDGPSWERVRKKFTKIIENCVVARETESPAAGG